MTRAPQSLSVGFISLGCAKNLVDAQNMAGVLLSENVTLASSPEEADVVLINTCAFIEDARRESIETVRAACRLKREGACQAVLVTGCFPQRYGTELQRMMPEVDAFLGLDQIERVAGVVRQLAAGRHERFQVPGEARELFEPKRPGLSFTGGPFAYLKIADGCNHPCAFCAIPGIRGRHRSRPVERIVAEAEKLLENGFRELNLISQDVTSYGRDRKGSGGLPELVRRLGAIGGKFWIRILYGYPSLVTDRLLEAMAATPQVCRYLDVPVQHSHPDILRAMARSGTIKGVRTLAGRIRAVMPDAVLRTTCLVGFPGEEAEHFDHLLAYVRETAFDHLGVFTYSPEEGTPAFSLPGRPAPSLAGKRRRRLMKAQKDIVDAKARALVGTETEVLLEHPLPGSPSTWAGRSPRYAPSVDGQVFVKGLVSRGRAGLFVRARYSAAREYAMEAEVMGE